MPFIGKSVSPIPTRYLTPRQMSAAPRWLLAGQSHVSPLLYCHPAEVKADVADLSHHRDVLPTRVAASPPSPPTVGKKASLGVLKRSLPLATSAQNLTPS